jgi:hypothetical protein
MANLYIRHYHATRVGSSGEATFQLIEPPAKVEAVVIGTLAAPGHSLAFDFEWITLVSEADCTVEFGVSPVALGPWSLSLIAGVPYTFGVQPARNQKLAVGV